MNLRQQHEYHHLNRKQTYQKQRTEPASGQHIAPCCSCAVFALHSICTYLTRDEGCFFFSFAFPPSQTQMPVRNVSVLLQHNYNENEVLTGSETAELGYHSPFELLNDLFHKFTVFVLAQGINVLIQQRNVCQVPDELTSMQTFY